jgi:hypothetical protein
MCVKNHKTYVGALYTKCASWESSPYLAVPVVFTAVLNSWSEVASVG